MPRPGLLKSLDVTLIVASLLVAFFIWLIAKKGETNHDTLTAPVMITKPNPLCEIKYAPAEMQIRVQYPASLRSYVKNGIFFIDLDVSDIHLHGAGLDEFSEIQRTMTLDNLKAGADLSGEIRPVSFMSSNKVVISARLNARPVAIEAQTTGSLAEGFALARPPVAEETDRLRLAGPQNRLAELAGAGEKVTLKTEPIDLAGRGAPDNVYAKALVPEGCYLASVDREQKILPLSDWRVLVALPIAEEAVERVIENVPLALVPFSSSVRFDYTPRAVSVRVKGPHSLVEGIAPSSFVLSAVSSVNETPGFTGETAIAARFAESVPEKTRDGVTIVAVDPPSIRVVVKAIEPLKEDRPTSSSWPQ